VNKLEKICMTKYLECQVLLQVEQRDVNEIGVSTLNGRGHSGMVVSDTNQNGDLHGKG